MLVFFDDILIYSPSLKQHEEILRLVSELLRKHTLFVKKPKCDFAKDNIEYLGHIIKRDGVKDGEEKIKAMQNCPILKDLKALRGFLGLIGYYKRIVAHYGFISKSLT